MLNQSNFLKLSQDNLERQKFFSQGSSSGLGKVQLNNNTDSGIQQINQMTLMRLQAEERLRQIEEEKAKQAQQREQGIQEQIQSEGQQSQREQMARTSFVGSTDQPANTTTEFGPAYRDEQGKLFATKDTDMNRINVELPKFAGQTEQASNMSTEVGPVYADRANKLFITKDTFGGDQNMANDVQVNQQFGNPNPGLYGPGGYNRGVDLDAKPNEPQYAPPEGNWVVESTNTDGSWNTGWGNSVVIKNTDTGETIRRSHFDKVLVKPGDEVTGKALGTTGRTGRTTGYHKDIEYTDPSGKLTDYMKSPYAEYEGGGMMEALKRAVFKEAKASEGSYPMAPIIDEKMKSPLSQEEMNKSWYDSLERNAEIENMTPMSENKIAAPTEEEVLSVAGDSEGFLKLYTPFAKQIEKETGVSYKLILAQAALESGWGKSAPGFNYFGIKGKGTAGSQNLDTQEDFGNGMVGINDTFRAYNSPEESFRDHARLISENPIYEDVVKAFETGDDQAIAKAIGNSPYATDPQYAIKIYNIMSKIK